MKKVLLIAASFVLVFAFAAMAQDAAAGGNKIFYGLKAGMGFATATGDSAEAPAGVDKKMRVGFVGGGVFAYEVVPSFQVQLEALYAMKGVKYESTSGSEKETIKLDYLEFPVTFHFVPATGGSIKPRIFAGPYVGILLTAKDKTEGFADPADNYDEDIKDFVKSTDFGVTFGAGADFAFASGALTLDVRYDLGLTKLGEAVSGDNPDIKSSSLFAMLGWRFGI